MVSNPVWFTVKEKKWQVGYFGKFSWTGKEEFWDSDNCTVSFARTLNGKSLIVVRSNKTILSSFMGKEVMLRYMLGFEISGKPSEPKTEMYTARNNIPNRKESPKNGGSFSLMINIGSGTGHRKESTSPIQQFSVYILR